MIIALYQCCDWLPPTTLFSLFMSLGNLFEASFLLFIWAIISCTLIIASYVFHCIVKWAFRM